MKKLTADKCRGLITHLSRAKNLLGVSMAEESYLEALEIALPILEQQDRGEDLMSTPQYVLDEKFKEHFGLTQQEHGEGEWIVWCGGECPTPLCEFIDVRWRAGGTMTVIAGEHVWTHDDTFDDIIAYRIIPERANKATLKDEMREWLIDECKVDMQRYTSNSPRYLVAQIALASLEDCCIIPERATNQNGEQ